MRETIILCLFKGILWGRNLRLFRVLIALYMEGDEYSFLRNILWLLQV